MQREKGTLTGDVIGRQLGSKQENQAEPNGFWVLLGKTQGKALA